MLNVIMLIVIMQSVQCCYASVFMMIFITLNFIMLIVIMLSLIMFSVVILSVVMLNVVAPMQSTRSKVNFLKPV